VIKFKGGIDP